ncbi:porin family protein [Flammeovirga agarivorans]|uniref:Outer membrane protein OmpA-like transmembrane domain-containing protein n=1 Tax=Flammeovirga agarivorans TaxID=2726742 RepID=A0A7X8SGN9_9BACT|nr:hypothetical protein [Flammeovirga agarivorans]NLR89798.1 hypothetical protein [Flammeovirga agarivorans]
MKNNQYYYLIIITILLTTTSINAQVYLGISGGASLINQNDIEFWQQRYEVEGVSTTRKLFIGYQFKYLGFELGNRFLGNVSEQTDLYVLNADKKGWDFTGIGRYSFGRLSAFVKAGVVFLSHRNYYTLIYENHVNTYLNKVKSQDVLLGVGSDFSVTNFLALRLEYEVIMVQESNNYHSITLGTLFKIRHK